MSQPTSPSTNRKNLVCRVLMLDDSEEIFYVPNKSLGGVLFSKVVQKLQLLEADYFDLQYKNVEGILCWLDHEKPITSHMPQNSLNFEFVVKFYTPDPGMLEEELTRYLFALQVKRDLATGRMPCQEQTAALLASYIVQAEFGDLTDEGYESNPDYLKSFKLFPSMNAEMEARIIQQHREHFGQTPMDADYNLLDTARKVEFYGICMHDAKDHEGVALHLAVTHMGVVVFQNMTRINTFSWAKIRKLSFKRKKFLIKLHPEGYGFYKDTVEFYFGSRNECKNFWKKCLEHHAFFRCQSVKKIPRNKTRVVSHGSSFRYSGKTQKQLVDFVRENFSKRPSSFLRSSSMRTVNFGGGATPRTGTLRSLRHSHQPQHESPQPLDEKSNQSFSPVKRDHRSSVNIQQTALNGTGLTSMQKNTNTLPKESKPSGMGENRNNQTKSSEEERGQPIRAKEDVDLQQPQQQQQQVDQLLSTNGEARLVQIKSEDSNHDLERSSEITVQVEEIEEENKTSMATKQQLTTFIPLSKQLQQQVTKDLSVQEDSSNHNNSNNNNSNDSDQNSSRLHSSSAQHQQFQLCHEIQQLQQQQSQHRNYLPFSPTICFPACPPNFNNSALNNGLSHETSDSSNSSRAQVMTTATTSTVFSGSLNMQVPQNGSHQPRYFCTDIDSIELPFPITLELPVKQPEEPHDDNKSQIAPPAGKPTILLNPSRFNPVVTASESVPHQSLEALKLSVNSSHNQQQQNKSHSISFLSKSDPPLALLTHESWTATPSRPTSSEVDQVALSSETFVGGRLLSGSNLVSLGSQLNEGAGEELSVPPTKNQLGGSNDGDLKKVISIPGYYMGKELLMTERTYKRDLEIIVKGFQGMMEDMGCDPPPSQNHVINETLRLFSPIHQFHSDFLNSVDSRISDWENFCSAFEKRKIGDLFASNISMLRLYNYFFSSVEDLLVKIYMTLNHDPLYRAAFLRFESSRTCYQPVSAFLLKPYQRLQHYEEILTKFIIVCGNDHADLENCEESKAAIYDVTSTFKDVHSRMINLQKLCELQQNVVGIGDLIQQKPQFIREGCLQKLSDNGYHQRLFILFDDFLVYANRRLAGSFQFVVHAHIPMENIQVEVFRKVNNNNNPQGHVHQSSEEALINNGFLIRVFGAMDARIIEVAASSTAEKNKWLEDLNSAVSFARRRREVMTRKNFFDSTEKMFNNNNGINHLVHHNNVAQESRQQFSPLSPLSPAFHQQQQQQLSSSSLSSSSFLPTTSSSSMLSMAATNQQQLQHTNTMMFVCWHRNTSVCMPERRLAVKSCLSGFLLRKFKTTSGWQKLWVSFSNLCLFFYKSHKDEFPLASLPLLGYSISEANQSDGIDKNFVFKLTFKSHAYFFRAESQCTFERWVEVISSTIESSRHFRLFSRVESFGVSST